jgi:RHS repeat-associated protein
VIDNDAWGRPETINYPSSDRPFSVSYTYDAYGHVDQLRDDQNAVIWDVLDVDAFGNDVEVQTIGGVVAKRRREPSSGRLQTAQVHRSNGTPVVPDEQYGYDARGLLARQQVNSPEASAQRTIAHDALGRIDYESTGGGTLQNYEYDDRGNLTVSPDLGTIAYNQQSGREVVETFDGHLFLHDEYGRQILRVGEDVPEGEELIEYASFDLPVKVDFGPGVSGSGSTPLRTTTFRYDAANRRTMQSSNDPVDGYNMVYVGDEYRRTRFDATGALEHVVHVPAPDGITIAVALEGTGAGDRNYRIAHGDNVDSPRVILDEEGNVREQRYWSAFGDFLTFDGNAGTRFGFTGHENDDDLGLVNMRGRMYDPMLGRFLTPDPIVQAPMATQGWNRHAYVANSPRNFVDPTGFEFGAVACVRQFDDLPCGSRPPPEPPPAMGGYPVIPAVVVPVPSGPPVASVGEAFVNAAIGAGQAVVGGAIAGVAVNMGAALVCGPLAGGCAAALALGMGLKAWHDGAFGEIGASIATALAGEATAKDWQVVGATAAGVLTMAIGGRVALTRGNGGARGTGHGYAANVLEGGTGRAFAGHGELRYGAGSTTIPEGTTLTTWTRQGRGISDGLGRLIEAGDYGAIAASSRHMAAIEGAVSHLPGARVPNYVLKAPTGLTVLKNSITVDSATSLSNLLRPGMGAMDWAACLLCR